MAAFSKVVVVGAGPAGLLTALLLAKRNISVQVVELSTKLDDQPRATHYGLPALPIMKEAGVLDDVRAEGFQPDTFCWRKLDGTRLTGSTAKTNVDGDERLACLPLNQLGKIIYKHLQRQPSANILWSTKVTNIGQDESKAWVDAETVLGETRFEADYIIGCDGANSQIRRSLFGNDNFPGRTWDEQIVATNVYYDFEKFKWEDGNFIIHPEHWFMAAKITKDGMWRVSYGEKAGLTREELIERQPMKYEIMLPGHPKPDQYKLVNISPYKIHQRLAQKMRVGRFLLVADAAHLCNPFGGMGLTGGLVDVEGLYQCLIGIYDGVADESILDRYCEVRRMKYQTIIDPISSANIRRLFSSDPDTALQDDEVLQMTLKGEKDKEFAKQMRLAAYNLQHDFKQYYHAPRLGLGEQSGSKSG